MQRFYDESKEAALLAVDSSPQGLTQAEAQARLERNGKNQLARGKKDSLLKRFFLQLADPMTLILLAAAAISGVLAVYENESFTDVIIILFVVVVNAVLGVYQENKAEKAIEALQEMAAATSKVLRDGQMVTVRSEDLVAGDVVLLEAGDAVPADGRILESASLKIEEAALTGESVPVNKFVDLIHLREGGKDVPLGDRKNMVYMGSTVVYGRGSAVITATGMDTEMGKIAGALAEAQEGQTPLQRKLSQLSKVLTWLVLGICLVIFGVQLLRAGAFSAGVVVDSFMVAVSLAVAAIPEGLAAVVTVVLSIGVTNMSKRNAIIRRLTAVETLGCAQIICSDKTGTLTQNQMTVVDHFGDLERTARAMALCSDAKLNAAGEALGEPTEAALVAWAAKEGLDKNRMEQDAPRVAEAPFDSGRKMMSTLHQAGGQILQFTKGAPDEVLQRCAWMELEGCRVELTEARRQEILAANQAMAGRALRVLCAACRIWDSVPADTSPANLERELTFLGLAGMIDPVRPEVKDAIAQCRSAGIRPIMITGDHVDTATAIARELGILEEGQRAVTGSQLDDMSQAEFEREFRNISVYARVQPEHKTRIVKAWQQAGSVTAMTGDGVNDAPSIKTADIGVGMGITGTDVTKNVADMVLADDNFATIVGAVEEGRRIYDNIRKAIQFLLGSNMSEVISIAVGLYHSTAGAFAVDQFDYRLLPCPGPGIGAGRAGHYAPEAPGRQGRNLFRRSGSGRGLSGPGGFGPHPGFLFCRSLYGVWRLGDCQLPRRHDHGLPDPVHGGDCPQLEYAQSEKQHLHPGGPKQSPESGGTGFSGSYDVGGGGSLPGQCLWVYPHPVGRVCRGLGAGSRDAPTG